MWRCDLRVTRTCVSRAGGKGEGGFGGVCPSGVSALTSLECQQEGRGICLFNTLRQGLVFAAFVVMQW